MEISIIEFCHVPRGALRGFVTIGLPCGLVIHDLRVSNKGAVWDAQIQQASDTNGTPNPGKSRRAISFKTEADRAAFSRLVIDALRLARPSIFAASATSTPQSDAPK